MDGNPEFVTPPAGRTEVVAPPVIKKVSWGAIFVGAIVSLAVLATLALLGFAVGLGSFNPDRYVNPLAGITVGTGIWWLIISIIAFFVGGWASSRLITPLYQSENVLHGVASWAVASLALVAIAGTAAGVIMGGGLGVLSSTVRANGPGNMISSTLFGAPAWNGQGWGYPAYGNTGWGYNPNGSYNNSGTNYGGQGMGGNTGTGYTGSSSTGMNNMNNTGSSSYPNGTTSTDTGSYSRSTYGNYGTSGTTGDVSGSTSGSSDMSNTGTSDQNTPRYGKAHKGKSSTGTSSNTYGTSGTSNTGTGTSNSYGTSSGTSSNTYGTSGTSGSTNYGTSGTSGTSSNTNTYGNTGTNTNMGTYGGSGMGSVNSPYNSNYANAQMRQIATQAAHTAATAAGWTFVMLILSLAAAAVGAGLSAPKNIPTARNMP